MSGDRRIWPSTPGQTAIWRDATGIKRGQISSYAIEVSAGNELLYLGDDPPDDASGLTPLDPPPRVEAVSNTGPDRRVAGRPAGAPVDLAAVVHGALDRSGKFGGNTVIVAMPEVGSELVQSIAEAVAAAVPVYAESHFQAGTTVIDPLSGEMRCWPLGGQVIDEVLEHLRGLGRPVLVDPMGSGAMFLQLLARAGLPVRPATVVPR